MYAAVAGFAELFGLKKQKTLVVPIGFIICIASMYVASNYPQHLRIGLDFTTKYIHLPIQIIIPVLALIVHYVRNGFKKNAEGKGNQCAK
jgi:spore germination protein KB